VRFRHIVRNSPGSAVHQQDRQVLLWQIFPRKTSEDFTNLRCVTPVTARMPAWVHK